MNMLLGLIFVSFLLIKTEASNGTVPHWKDLECQTGHKYLFSDIERNWEDSRGECELYGGWLVQINELKEYNCLMRHGLKEETKEWYWTDGNDVANSGVWTHALDGTEVSFFPARVRCNCAAGADCSNEGDAYLLNISDLLQYRGNYCDEPSS